MVHLDGIEESTEGRKRVRGPAKPYPLLTFESVLVLAAAIMEHGVDGRLNRRTLFDKLERSPDSSLSRNMVTASSKYDLTKGGYAATDLEMTDDGRIALEIKISPQEALEKRFNLSIERFQPFRIIFEKLKGRRLPDKQVLSDEFARNSVPKGESGKAAEIFTENLRFIGLLRNVNGSEQVIGVEEVPASVPNVQDVQSASPTQQESQLTVPATVAPPLSTSTEISSEPTVHIDVQIHIDSSATFEQIDQIFSSMARHLYGRES